MYKERLVHVGDRLTVQTLKGRAGNVIGRLSNGRAILFGRDSPYLSMLGPGQEVDCRVVHVAPRYVIVEPIREPIPLSEMAPPRQSPPQVDESLLDELEAVAKQSGWDATVARALLHIIERLGKL